MSAFPTMILNRSQRYIFRQVAVSMLFIVITLTLVIWLTQSMRFVKFILNKGLALETFLHLTVLLLPSFLLLTLPIALFFGTLFTFNKLTNDRELVVMRSTGMSHFSLAKPVMLLALIVTGVCYFISLYLMPLSFRDFRALQYEVRNNFSAGLIQEGTFNNFGRGLTMYVRERNGQTLRGILVQDNRKPNVAVTMMAEQGLVTNDGTGTRVIMSKGNRQELDRKTGKLTTLFFETYSFDLAWLAQTPKETWRQPSERFLGELLHPNMNDPGDKYYAKKLIAEGHNRLSAPLYALGLPLLAVLILLVGEFNKRGQARRLAIAFGMVGVIQGAAVGIFSAAAKVNELIPLMYANAALPLLIGFYLLVRGSRGGRRSSRAAAPGVNAAPAAAE